MKTVDPHIRSKTDLDQPNYPDKREQILHGATQVFLDRGYANTSMDRVAMAAGVSKQTIYSYFQDKEGLFTALIERITLERMQLEFGAESLEGEPRLVLRQLAIAYLKKIDDHEYLALLRVVIAESQRFPELARLFTRTVICKGTRILTRYLATCSHLHIQDLEATSRIFWGSLVSFVITQEIMYGRDILPMQPERMVESLVELILNQQ